MLRTLPRRLALLAALSLPLLHSQDAGAIGEPLASAIRSDGRVVEARRFLDGLGVNGHVSWPGHYPYSETQKVADAMRYLGIANLRDYINSSTLGSFESLAARGVRFDLLLNPKVGLGNYLAWARRLALAYPGSVVALEGPNEVDKWPVEFQGLRGFPAASATQKALHAAAKRDPVLARIPIYNLTVSGISRSNAAALGDLSAHADYANVHPYYRAGQQSWGHSLRDGRYTLENYLVSARWSAPRRPVVVTETGSTSSPASAIGVTEEVQAKQILNSLFAAAKHNAEATYIYELVDSGDGGRDDIESNYGLYRYDWTPKPAGHALHNLTSILGGRGAGASRAMPPPAYTLEGMPATGSTLLFREDDGTYDIVLWAEPDLWDEEAKAPITPPAHRVRVTLDATYPSLAVFDPLIGKAPLQTYGPSNTVSVSLTDHPLIIKLAPPPGSRFQRPAP